MDRRKALLFPASAALGGALHADPANGDPRLEILFAMFIAPCCWRENLLAHHSPMADELRADIRQRVAGGQTDAQIKEAYLKKYTLRILAVPDGTRGQWLSWTPLAATVAGAAAVGLVIKRMLRPAAAVPVVAAGELPNVDWDWEMGPPPEMRGGKQG